MRIALRMLALLGAVGVGLLLFRGSPRDVVLVYDLGGQRPHDLQVVIRRGGEVLRRATFPAPAGQVRHPVRLPDGDYQLEYRLAAVGPAATPEEGRRELSVHEAGTIVLSLAR